ncbi:MAG: hypothetical protein QHI48_06480 [Bacteroidota bacterium]|nr:hypothetical protein [Bacteroidota bacterium]
MSRGVVKKTARRGMAATSRSLTIPCPVCREVNDVLAVRCSACGAFIRDRVPTLNFFTTLWNICETPVEGLIRVIRSEQKNYVYVLFSLGGLFAAVVTASLSRAGETSLHPAVLFAALYVLGLPGGIILGTVFSFVLDILIRRGRIRRIPFRTVSAVAAWSFAPYSVMSAFLVPVLFALFGKHLFAWDPGPWSLKPGPFWVVSTLLGAAVLASFLLTARGVSLLGVGVQRAVASVFGALVIALLLVAGASVCVTLLVV